jgi:hemolysin III
MSVSATGGKVEPKFSIWLFLLVNVLSFAGLCAALALIAPSVWQAQLAASWLSVLAVFLGVHGAAAFVEFFFHRYVLHAPLVPFLAYFYKQHTLHHALTRIGYQKGRADPAAAPDAVENRYPIVEEKQFEASYFPWYSLVIFTLVGCVVLVPLQLIFPAVPFLLGGFIAVAWSLVLYEVIHAIEHWPQATWDRLVVQPRTGRFWRKAYAFHLRHHADIRCNEAISGLFGLPVPDWIFGTYVDPSTLYKHGQSAAPEEFVSPAPRFGFLRWLDRMAEQSVQLRRQRRTAA